MLSYGATRVELGVQHADDRIYALINRGHAVKDVVDATRELKDAGFKVLYHIMPGLPGSNKAKDISFVRKLFSDPRFRPDMLKIYPTLVIPGTGLEKMAKEGRYHPYSAEEAADAISEFYRYIPPYVRVMRIQRDIPAGKIGDGVKKSNLRELVEGELREKRITPNEIRYREIGLQRKAVNVSDFEMKRLVYDASGGKEVFLSYENDANLIAGFIRLRLPKTSARDEVDNNCALIRELHVYGQEVPLKENPEAGAQHRGLGSRLLAEAERISRDMGKEKMIVISGVGVREYYRRHGYRNAGPYMGKKV
jgi:elongator complex protein 3